MRKLSELDAHLDRIRESPRDRGTLEMIVLRPAQGARHVVAEATLDAVRGMVGDRWETSPNKRTPDGSPNPLQQLTLMNVRALAALTTVDQWPLAGDQLLVDFDLSHEHLPTGTRLAIGNAIVEVTEALHTGCAKFTERFGSDATKWVNSDVGLALRLRGVNARVIQGDTVRQHDVIRVSRGG